MSPYKVIVVLDRDFGERLLALPKGTPVWIVDTPTNRAAAKRAWAERAESSDLDGVTVFDFAEKDSAEEILTGNLDTIDLHHGVYSADPPFTVLESIGAHLTASVRKELIAFGFDTFEQAPSGFRASRPLPSKELD